MARAFISVGSNIHPAKNVREAIHLLALRTRIVGISTVYQTEAEDRPEQPSYYNCLVEIVTEIPPIELKYEILRKIEEALGRERGADKYAPRTIDLDLIVYDDLVMETRELKLPDPQILSRPYVAIPLGELAPGLVLPGLGLGLEKAAEKLPRDQMEPLHRYTADLRKEMELGNKQREGRAFSSGTPGRNR